MQLDKIDKEMRTQASSNGGNMSNARIGDSDPILYDSIFTILRRSFDSLSDDEKLLFLDVAHFCPGGKKTFLPWARTHFFRSTFRSTCGFVGCMC